MLCDLWRFCVIVKGQAWIPKVGDPSPGLWTTRQLPTPWNINQQELPQRSLSEQKDQAPLKGWQNPVLDASNQTFSTTRTQPSQLADWLPKVIPSLLTPQNKLLDMALPFRETQGHSIHKNTGISPPNQETFTRHRYNPTHGEQATQLRGTKTFQPAERRLQIQ